MFITYHIFVIHSCPEDRSSAWINIKHSEFPEIPRECFPGVSGRSWQSLSPPCVCVRNHGGRAEPLLPLLYPLLAYAYSVKYVNCLKSEEWTFLACVSLGRPCSQLYCNSKGHCVSRTSRSVGSIQNVDCVYIAPIGREGEGGIVWLRKKDLGDVPLLS